MRELRIGRILPASLHQGISDLLPARLEFYETWLTAEAIRSGTVGLAPLTAVLSFLRSEGAAYGAVSARAGECAAEWTVEEISTLVIGVLRRAPVWVRKRIAVLLVTRLVRRTYPGSRARARGAGDSGAVHLSGSVFCDVRVVAREPLCRYYEALYTRFLGLLGLPGRARVIRCCAMGDAECVLVVQNEPSAGAAPGRLDDPEES